MLPISPSPVGTLNERTQALIRPPCGAAECNERATHADVHGVGFCKAHRHASLTGDAKPSDTFDPWWAAAVTAASEGDTRWAGLEYGEWPVGGAS